MESGTSEHDVAIVGGGLNGMTAALAVADLGFRVALVDPNPASYELPEPFDPRSYAITQTSIQIYKTLGVWARVDESRNADILRMAVWDGGSRGHLEFTPEPILVPRFGVITEHANLGRALAQTIDAHSRIEIHTHAVRDLVLEADRRELLFDNNASLKARLVVCADGGSSNTRSMLGIEVAPIAYRQKALVCNIATALPHDNIARQVFHREGPLAFLPLADPRQSAVVWTNSFETDAELMSLPDEGLAERIEAAFDSRLGHVRVVSRRFDFPLSKMHVPRYDAERAVLVGDAAHVVHPLAGQGLNLGIMDAAVLAEVLAPLAGDPKLSATPLRRALRRYSRWRAHDNGLMLHATDTLNKLFAQQLKPLRLLRGLGLDLTNNLPPLVKMFTQHAVGNTGELPKLAR